MQYYILKYNTYDHENNKIIAGEDGFEISVPTNKAVELTRTFLTPSAEGTVLPTGLGARDSLRLEAGIDLLLLKIF